MYDLESLDLADDLYDRRREDEIETAEERAATATALALHRRECTDDPCRHPVPVTAEAWATARAALASIDPAAIRDTVRIALPITPTRDQITTQITKNITRYLQPLRITK